MGVTKKNTGRAWVLFGEVIDVIANLSSAMSAHVVFTRICITPAHPRTTWPKPAGYFQTGPPKVLDAHGLRMGRAWVRERFEGPGPKWEARTPASIEKPWVFLQFGGIGCPKVLQIIACC